MGVLGSYLIGVSGLVRIGLRSLCQLTAGRWLQVFALEGLRPEQVAELLRIVDDMRAATSPTPLVTDDEEGPEPDEEPEICWGWVGQSNLGAAAGGCRLDLPGRPGPRTDSGP